LELFDRDGFNARFGGNKAFFGGDCRRGKILCVEETINKRCQSGISG
jgi:hypothetical protein